MAVDVQPPALAQLLETAERPRAHNWSLRAALTRYAQPQPQRASDIIELLRRIEFAMQPHAKLVEREGPAIWQALQAGSLTDGAQSTVVELLRSLVELDRLGDVLAAWAVDREGERPDDLVDTVVADVGRRLEDLGIPREERSRPTGRRS